jgi:lipopolysaccharide export LptBFGC system permease protein LptF
MLKNKIYKYFSQEILKNFITILVIFTAVAWTVRAVNFLDLMVNDGFTANIYLKYSFLNITNIAMRFVSLSFLLSLIISIVKFERQQEFLILWTIGLNKIKIINIFFFIALLITLLQVLMSFFLNPFLLNKSRQLLKVTEVRQINNLLKSNEFTDSFKGITFYVAEKTKSNELNNIFIKDTNGSLNTMVSEVGNSDVSTIFAKKGYIANGKLILFDGFIQSLGEGKIIKNIFFKKTELNINNFTTRTITQPKIQETSSQILLQCLYGENNNNNLLNCSYQSKKEVISALSRRLGTPLYLPLISIIASFLLIYKKENKYNYLRKYIIFIVGFIVLIFAEIFLKFTGFSVQNTFIYFLTPIILFMVTYLLLYKNLILVKKI